MEPGFKYDGALAPDRHSHLYVERQEDHAVWQALNNRAGIDCCIVSLIGARQTGKTSLLNSLQTRCRVANAGWVIIKLDLSGLSEFQGQAWYQQLSVACCHWLKKYQIVLSMKELQEHCASVFLQPFTAKGWTELLSLACQRLEPGQKLLVILDELNSTPPEQWEPFFSNIRAIHQAASSLDDRPEYRALSLVLAGTFVPTQLIKNVEHSPFNVSTKVYMLPVAAEQLAPLLKLLSQAGKSLEPAAEERIYYWTAGLLLHVQRLCATLMAAPEDSVTITMVDRCAEEIQFDDTYLNHVVKRLGEHEHLVRRAAAILERPLKSDRNSDIIATLEIIGVIRHQPAMHHWCITNRLCELTLVNHFSAYFAQGGTEVADPLSIAILTKGIDFLFGEATKLMQERRDARQKRGEDDDASDTPSTIDPVTAEEVKKAVQAKDPKQIYLSDINREIEHCIKQIQEYRKHRRLAEQALQAHGSDALAPPIFHSNLESADDGIKKYAQRLKDTIEKAYGHKITIVGLD